MITDNILLTILIDEFWQGNLSPQERTGSRPAPPGATFDFMGFVSLASVNFMFPMVSPISVPSVEVSMPPSFSNAPEFPTPSNPFAGTVHPTETQLPSEGHFPPASPVPSSIPAPSFKPPYPIPSQPASGPSNVPHGPTPSNPAFPQPIAPVGASTESPLPEAEEVTAEAGDDDASTGMNPPSESPSPSVSPEMSPPPSPSPSPKLPECFEPAPESKYTGNYRRFREALSH